MVGTADSVLIREVSLCPLVRFHFNYYTIILYNIIVEEL